MSDPVRLRRFESTLPVQLTESEQREHAKAMAAARRERAQIEAQAKGVANEYKSRIAAAELQIERHARCVESGTEPREVECADELRGLLVVTVRLDTGEIIKSRPANESDRQVALFESEADDRTKQHAEEEAGDIEAAANAEQKPAPKSKGKKAGGGGKGKRGR